MAEKTGSNGRLLLPHQAARAVRKSSLEAVESSVAPAPMPEIDLSAMRLPRRAEYYRSPTPSNPSVSSLGNDKSPSHDNQGKQSPDIRGKLAPESQLVNKNGHWIDKSFWDESDSVNVALHSEVYVNPWVGHWAAKDETGSVAANFLYEVDSASHCHSDVNTYTGKLLAPVEYPYTTPDFMNEWTDSAERQMTATSNLYIQQKGKNRKGHYGSHGRYSHGPVFDPLPADQSQTDEFNAMIMPRQYVSRTARPGPPVTTTQMVQQPLEEDIAVSKEVSTVTTVKPKFSETEVDPYEPLVQCHIRPAKMQDMQGALDIYNWEVVHGTQARDTKTATLTDFETLLKQHQNAKLPFVIVKSGQASEQKPLALPNQNSAAGRKRAYLGRPALQNQPVSSAPDSDDSDDGETLAFGFITLRQTGLCGSFTGTGCKTGVIRVFERQDVQTKKVGEACVDALLAMVSHRYSSKLNLFRDTSQNPVYGLAGTNGCNMISVFYEHLVPRLESADMTGKFVPDQMAITRMEVYLKSRFNFWKVVRLDATHFVDPWVSDSKRDTATWMDTIVFEHACHPEGVIFGA